VSEATLTVKMKKVTTEDVEPPRYQTDGAAGFDLRADLRGGILVLFPGWRQRVSCGYAFEIPAGHFGDVRGRSGWTERGVYVANGCIDPDYRGVVGVHLENRSGAEVEIAHGDRIAQMVIVKAPQAALMLVDKLGETVRSGGGFGHTGVR
jgi:dUTP pyrophosphatase